MQVHLRLAWVALERQQQVSVRKEQEPLELAPSAQEV
ncbi:MAG: hypothetical protein ACI9R3_003169 [Verrucomicrobiales bacterium]